MAERLDRVEAILAQVKVAHEGLHQAVAVANEMQRLFAIPYSPASLAKVRPAFDAINAVHAALQHLIAEMKADG